MLENLHLQLKPFKRTDSFPVCTHFDWDPIHKTFGKPAPRSCITSFLNCEMFYNTRKLQGKLRKGQQIFFFTVIGGEVQCIYRMKKDVPNLSLHWRGSREMLYKGSSNRVNRLQQQLKDYETEKFTRATWTSASAHDFTVSSYPAE